MALEDAADLELLKRISDGEEAAFVALYRRWQGNVYRCALRISGKTPIAEDITQEVFLALMDGGSRFDPGRGSFAAYLFGITRNHVLRRVTRERIFAPFVDDGEEERTDSRDAVRQPPDPLVDLTRKESVESLHQAIMTLPLRYREVVVWCELEELSYVEAARVIGCPAGTVRSRLHRARALLLNKLQDRTSEDAHTPKIGPARCLS
jgi:RNA polymerase sigma-70 factor (ECF subfamily)